MPLFFGDGLSKEDISRVGFFYDNFRYLTVIGGSYGFFHTTNWSVISISVYVVMYTTMILGTLNFLYTSYLVRDNLAAATQCFHLFLIGCVVLAASLTLTLGRTKLAPFVDFMANPHFCEYSKSSFHRKIDRETKRKKNILLIVWFCSYGFCGVVGLVNYAIDDHLGKELSMNITDVYWKKVPLMSYWPLDAHETTLGWITLSACLSLYALFAPLMVISAIILCFNAMDHLFNQFRLLTHSIVNLDRRALIMFKQKFPKKSPSDLESEFDSCYHECIRQNVVHHQKIMILVNIFRSVGSIPIGVPFLGGAMLLGLAMINLTSDDDPRVGPKLLLLALASTEALNMFLLCKYGETMEELSEEVYDAIFYSKWYRRSEKCRRTMLTFRCGTQKPVRITPIKMIVLNMATFADLVNSAYSIFNLSQVSN